MWNAFLNVKIVFLKHFLTKIILYFSKLSFLKITFDQNLVRKCFLERWFLRLKMSFIKKILNKFIFQINIIKIMFGLKTKKNVFFNEFSPEREIHVIINLIGTTNMLSFHWPSDKWVMGAAHAKKHETFLWIVVGAYFYGKLTYQSTLQCLHAKPLWQRKRACFYEWRHKKIICSMILFPEILFSSK